MIYLDHAATTFKKPPSVYQAVYDTMVKHGANAGRGGYGAVAHANELLYETKVNLANLFHVKNPERIAFSYNTTHALNMGIKGVLSYGDHVILSSMEHNSVLRPVKALEKRLRVSYSLLRANEKGELNVEDLEKLIQPNTKLIVLTHSSNVTGNITDIYKAAEIAHKHNILFMVDAAQSAGTLDINASKLDILAFPGHKGLMGPMGTGGIYVREELMLNTIIEGGTGSLSESMYQPEMMPDRLESGTQNVPAIAGLNAAVKFISEIGTDAIYAHEKMLLKRFEERVLEIPGVNVYGGEQKTAICAMNLGDFDCVTLATLLNDRYNISVRAGLHCAILAHQTLHTERTGCVRFSFGFFNTPYEVDKAVNALYEISKEL